MSLAVEGILHKIFEEVQVTDRFRKREFVLEMINDFGYKQYPKFQATQEKCNIVSNYKEGERVRVHFNLVGRPFNNQNGETIYFTNLDVWRIEHLQPLKYGVSSDGIPQEGVDFHDPRLDYPPFGQNKDNKQNDSF